MLSPGQWEDLLSFLEENIPVSPCAEITVEANPESFSERHAAVWKKRRVSKVSIGVQSFSDGDLLWLGRPHDASKACEAVRTAVLGGFSVSADLMFGLRDQTLRSWAGSVKTALGLGVDHISLYQLSIDEGCRWNSSPPSGRTDGYPFYRWSQWYLPRKGFSSMKSPVFPCPGATAATTPPTGGGIPSWGLEQVPGVFSGKNGTGMRAALRGTLLPFVPSGEAWPGWSRSQGRRLPGKQLCFCSGHNGAFPSTLFRTNTVRQYLTAFRIPSGGKLPPMFFGKPGQPFADTERMRVANALWSLIV